MKILDIGFNNSVVFDKIVAVVSAEAAPVRRLREEAKRQGRLIDATNGRKTRAVIITTSNHVILSGINPETLAERIKED
ncbi:MAG: extracellular matrix/biofilm biosynthesis regulator RemA family protein [Candidatus Omnitrophota bacterium]